MERASRNMINVDPERIRELLKDLVDIYSPSGKEEEILEFTDDYLKSRGLKPVKQRVDENRYNLVVLPEGRDDITLCFVGHMDTVTAYDLDDYGFRESGDDIIGLGTSDMKAGCAAMIETFGSLAERGYDFPPVGLALLVDEEENSSGARALMEVYNFPWAIIGEPTNMAPCLGHYTYLEALLRTQGKRAHSAVPEMGNNAIEAMLRLLLRVTGYLSSEEHVVYNIRDMSGFPGGFIVSDGCEAWLDIHLKPDASIRDLKANMQKVVKKASKELPLLDARLEFENTYPGYKLSADNIIVRNLKETFERLSIPWAPEDFRSHSDGAVLQAHGVSPIILGPGRLEAAHTPEESVPFAQVVQAARVYADLALSLPGI